MKEHPIIFSGPMARAILENRKSQTRRVLHPQPYCEDGHWYWEKRKGCRPNADNIPDFKQYLLHPWHAKYQKGDLLWVKETWAHTYEYDGNYLIGKRPALYRATNPDYLCPSRWHPSIFMSKKLARIWLEITDVCVERIQDISEEDAIAEGIEKVAYTYGAGAASFPAIGYTAFPEKDGWFCKAKDAFEALWDSINAKRGSGWDTNPWVWAISFRRIERCL